MRTFAVTGPCRRWATRRFWRIGGRLPRKRQWASWPASAPRGSPAQEVVQQAPRRTPDAPTLCIGAHGHKVPPWQPKRERLWGSPVGPPQHPLLVQFRHKIVGMPIVSFRVRAFLGKAFPRPDGVRPRTGVALAVRVVRCSSLLGEPSLPSCRCVCCCAAARAIRRQSAAAAPAADRGGRAAPAAAPTPAVRRR
jgi:hypothetical protein